MEAEDKPYNDYFLEKMDGAKRIGPPMSKDWDAAEILIQTLAIFYKSTLVLLVRIMLLLIRCTTRQSTLLET